MKSQIRLGAILWIVSIEFLLAQFIAQAAYPTYAIADMDISLLGVTACAGLETLPARHGCSPLHLVFNLGAALNGALVMAGVWFTRRLWPPSPLTTTALWLLAVGGGGGILVIGGFPLNISQEVHTAGAMLALFVPCFGMAILASLYWNRRRAFALYSGATATLCFCTLIAYGLEVYFGLGRGTMERIMAWPHTIWYPATGMLILGGYLRPSA